MWRRLKRFWGWLMGIHVCEEFTRWTEKKGRYSRPVTYGDLLVDVSQTELVFTRRWQERQCTICGKIQQRDLAQ